LTEDQWNRELMKDYNRKGFQITMEDFRASGAGWEGRVRFFSIPLVAEFLFDQHFPMPVRVEQLMEELKEADERMRRYDELRERLRRLPEEGSHGRDIFSTAPMQQVPEASPPATPAAGIGLPASRGRPREEEYGGELE
jgi:hypothetical protein